MQHLRARLVRALLGERIATVPLFDTPRFCRSLEAAYLRMQELAAPGEAPLDVRVGASEACGRGTVNRRGRPLRGTVSHVGGEA